MRFDRRTFVAALGAALPSTFTSSCARASEGTWPGVDTPQGLLPKMPIGMNLASIASYERGFPFRNLMWGAGRWMTRNAFGGGPWDTGQATFFEYDKDGYPIEVPIQTPKGNGIPQYVAVSLPNVLTPGRYTLLYDGEGSFDTLPGTKIVAESPGRVELYMTQSLNVAEGLIIRRSKRGNHIRNMRVLAKSDTWDDVAANPFRKDFLEFCKPFHVLRFMDWTTTNGSLEVEWSRRKHPSFYTMIGASGDAEGLFGEKPGAFLKMYAGGVSHEIIINLANTLQIDPWICIPHQATDEYIRSCANLYHKKLNSDRKLYLEYSNETWNWQFFQAQWMLQSELAAELVLRKGVTPWETKNGQRKGTAFPQRMGSLFSRCFRIWLDQWPDRDRHRVTTVCAVQAGWAATAMATVDWCKDDGYTTAVAAAAYFGASEDILKRWELAGAKLTADDVIADMRAVVAAQGLAGSSSYQIARRAADHGLAFLNYEGGQHLVTRGQQATPYLPALAGAQTHPAMYELYVETIRQQKRLGSRAFCAFTSIGQQDSRWGAWGAKASYDTPDDSAPKMRALLACNS